MIKRFLPLALITVIFIAFSLAPSASAAGILEPVKQTQSTYDQFVNKLKQTKKATEKVTGKKAEKLIKKAKKQLRKGNINIHVPDNATIDYKNAIAAKVKHPNQSVYTVLLPYKNSDLELGSSVTVTLSTKNFKLLRSQELILKNESPEIGSFEYYRNGKEIKTGSIQKDDYEDIGKIRPAFDFGEFNDCLASMGVANWAIAVIVTVCGAACGTVILCAACVEGALLAYSFELQYCLDQQAPSF